MIQRPGRLGIVSAIVVVVLLSSSAPACGDKQHEAREVVGEVFDVLLQDGPAVESGSLAAGDGGAGAVPGVDDGLHASGRIVGHLALDRRMPGEEALALRQRHRVRLDFANILERRSGDGDQTVRNRQYDFIDDAQAGFVQQVVALVDGAGQRVFEGSDDVLGAALADGAEQVLELPALDRNYAVRETAGERRFR